MQCEDVGFFYPQIIDIDKCVNCGNCLKKCPVFKDNIPNRLEHRKQELYFWVKDKDELLSSSSGGLATYLYRKFLAVDAYIVGVEYTEDCKGAQYILTKNVKKINRFKGSKYIQARKYNIYRVVKETLDSGNKVLFIGLPCEVAAMKRFTDSDNLYTCELVCHGPTSSEVLHRYISHLEERQEASVVNYTCRYKNPHWKPVNSRIIYDDGTDQVQVFATTELGKAFQMVKRYSCYHCKYKNGVTAADLTIGDFHAANKERDDYNVDGVSICLVNTQKGQTLVQSLADDEVVTGIANHAAAMANRALVESLPKLPGRQRFIRIMKHNGIDAACRDMIIVAVLKYRQYPHRIRRYMRRFFQ
jgi:coenzyme F420-reducing hydrogenase beta subunit